MAKSLIVTPEELREIEQQVLAEMPTSGRMLTRSQLGRMQALLRHQKGTKSTTGPRTIP